MTVLHTTVMVRWLKGCIQIIAIAAVLLLTGCLQYDLDLQFDSQTHGQLVQEIRWRGSAPAPALDPWVQVLRDRTQAIGGTLHPVSPDALQIRIPFNNGAELVTKFNQFFTLAETETPLTLPGGEPIRAELRLQQGNWLLAIHNHLQLTVDLTGIPDLAQTTLPLLQGATLLQGQVTVTAPWGVRSPTVAPLVSPTWPLTVGELNQVEADFWVPSPIGIGAVAIAVLVALGYGIKYGL